MQPERLFQSPYEDRATTRIDIVFPKGVEADAVVTVLRNTERAATPAAQAGAMSSA